MYKRGGIKGIFTIITILGVVRPPLGASEIWYQELDGDIWALETFKDLNGDGMPEVAAGTAGNHVYGLDGESGEILWTYPASGDTGGDVWSLLVLPMGDGADWLVAGTAANEILVIDSGMGAGVHAVPTTGDVWSLATLGDVTADGVPEVVAGAADDLVRCLDVITGNIIWDYPTGSDVWTVAGGEDLDGDMIPDAVAGGADDTIHALSGCLSCKRPIWTYEAGGDVWSIALGPDADGDGIADVFAGTYVSSSPGPGGLSEAVVLCLSGAETPPGPRVVWRMDWFAGVRSDVWKVRIVPDLNGDGMEDVAAGGSDDFARVLDALTGDIIWSFDSAGEIKDIDVLPDVTDDGLPEILISTTASQVHALSGADGSEIWAYPLEISATVYHVRATADIDFDGKPDCVAGSALNTVNCLQGDPHPFSPFWRGDANSNGLVTIADTIAILAQIFRGGTVITCMDAADFDDNGTVELLDGVASLMHFFRLGPGPAEPTGYCGEDRTPDSLPDCVDPNCAESPAL